MSAWYLFSAMGFYPGTPPFFHLYLLLDCHVSSPDNDVHPSIVDPASAEYVIGTPFFDSLTLDIPGASRPLTITSKGAGGGRKKYIKNIQADGLDWTYLVLDHGMIGDGRDFVFEMGDTPQSWGISCYGCE